MPPAVRNKLTVDALFAGVLLVGGATIGFVVRAEVSDSAQRKDIETLKEQSRQHDERLRAAESKLTNIEINTQVTRAILEGMAKPRGK